MSHSLNVRLPFSIPFVGMAFHDFAQADVDIEHAALMYRSVERLVR